MISNINNKTTVNRMYSSNINIYKKNDNRLSFSDQLKNLTYINSKLQNKTNSIQANQELEKLKNEMHEKYDKLDGENSFTSTTVMEKVIDLDIANSKDKYLKADGEADINKVADVLGISLSNCSIKEINSITTQLHNEGFLSDKTAGKLSLGLLIQGAILSAKARETGESVADMKFDLMGFLLSSKDFYEKNGDSKTSDTMDYLINFLN
ncbi:hypothetical protein ACUH7Y_22095 [Clostridium beijerinckii]|uniref:Uncharacterized protein n=1 Tax=Clostridium beijerinckii TaxID=1520 RepID=A0A7X9SJN8_CLOBE|nr:hypothetical protein [Clostridium beijerinckii]NMF03141.1 hypothetical protein [Clostridium beijerinckii]